MRGFVLIRARRCALAGAALAAALLLVPAVAQAATCAPPPQAAATAQAVLAEANALRRGAGLAALAWDDRLAEAARIKACDLSASGTFAHSGSDLRKRARAAGCRFSGPLAENLGWGSRSAAQAVQQWLDSAPHRANLLHRRVRSAGAAWMPRAQGGGYWVLVLAGRCG